jgi:hypothetical protein
VIYKLFAIAIVNERPMMEKCALIISANESYQKGEKDLETFTGIPVSHSTLHRLVKNQ